MDQIMVQEAKVKAIALAYSAPLKVSVYVMLHLSSAEKHVCD